MSAELALILTKCRRNYFLPTLILLCLQIILGNGDGPNCSQKSAPKDLYKNGAMNVRYMWGRVGHKIHVPVVLDSKYSYRERGIILGGLGEIQKKTCVDFYVFNHTSALSGYDYVYITKSKEGCWSHVGRVGGGQQELSLARGCINHRTAVHEMIHALGFTHEHVRADRDEYVRINWGNIQKGRERNFVKRDRGRDPYGPYDYGSIMHYDRRAFSVNGEDTIRPLKHPGAKIGLGQTMSYWDTKRILHMYKCGNGYGAEYGSGYDGGAGDSNNLDYDDGQNQNHEQHPEHNPSDHNHNKRHPTNHNKDYDNEDDYFQNLNSPQDFGENRPRQQSQQQQRHQPGRHIDQDYHYEYNPSSNRNQNQNGNNRHRGGSGGGHSQQNPPHKNRNQFHLPDDVEDYRDKHSPPRFSPSQSYEQEPHQHQQYHSGIRQNTQQQQQQRRPNNHQQDPFYNGGGFDYDYEQRHPQTQRGTTSSIGLQDSPLYGVGNAQQQYGLNLLGQNYYRF